MLLSIWFHYPFPGHQTKIQIMMLKPTCCPTLCLLEKSLEAGVQKIIFASSGGTVYGIPKTLPIPETHSTDPICSYGICKLTIEKYLNLFNYLHGLKHVILRLGNPYGKRQKSNNVQGAIAVFLGKALRGEEIVIWGDGSVARDYFHVNDLTDAFAKAVEVDTQSNIYNIASGMAVSLSEVVKTIERVIGKKLMIRNIQGRKFDVPTNCLDISLASKELGWQPKTSLEDGIKWTWEWLNNQSGS